MKIRINTKFKLFVSFFIITFSDALYFYKIGWNNRLNYLGLFLLLLTQFERFIKIPFNKQIKLILFELIPVSFIFSIGIMVQNMSISIKIRLILSMIIIACIALLSDQLLGSLEDLRGASYGIIWGVICVFVLSVITKTSIVSRVEEGNFLFGLSMGLKHKNNCGMDLLAAFCGLFIYRRNQNRKQTDLIALWILIILIMLTHARIAWALLALFIFMMHLDVVRHIGKKYRKSVTYLFFCGFITCICFGFQYISIHSATTAIRIKGLLNWLNFFHGDWFHIVFGNAALAWADTGYDYVMNVRSAVGMDGTLEMAILGIFIKNGAVGFIGYFIIFKKYIKGIRMIKNDLTLKISMTAMVFIMLISMLTESFIINLAVVFGSYCFLTVGGVLGIGLKKEKLLENKMGMRV